MGRSHPVSLSIEEVRHKSRTSFVMQLSRDPNQLHQLMRQAKSGDAAAFAELYKACYVPVYRYALLRTGVPADAEDIAQTTFVRAYAALQRFVSTEVSPLAYLFTITRNQIIDRSRKHRELALENEQGETIDVVDNAPPLDESVGLTIAGQQAMLAISKLPDIAKDVLIWRYIHGLSSQEIADLLSKSEAAIRQIQSRALKQLRALMAHQIPYVHQH